MCLHVPVDFLSAFKVSAPGLWPAACILSDHSPRTVDTLRWAHKEPHAASQENKEPFVTRQQGKCATLRSDFFSPKAQMFMSGYEAEHAANVVAMDTVLEKRTFHGKRRAFVRVLKCKDDVSLMSSSLFFLSTCFKERAHRRGESQVQITFLPSGPTFLG